ncbi:MAG: transporter substrate-binding domain-containing protein [Clostridia bacterium]|nr:transporter substrate-binding domain-containing protein [Clostridia bacterium]
MLKRAAALLLCIALVTLCLLPAAAAEESPKVVRVGWYDTPFNYKDSFGRRTGYAYEYQRKIAAYTGWKYEYVEGNWPELLQMLRDGKIDLMSDVSYTPERAEEILYAGIPMGEELYFLYVAPNQEGISPDDYATLNGKTVGVTKGSVQRDLFIQWAESHGVSPVIQELDSSEAESLVKLSKGMIDAFVTLDTYGDPNVAVPLWKIGSSDFYFAVSKNRAELLPELDAALNRIQDENKHYSEQLTAKYLQNSGTNLYLTVDEREWLEAHGPIRVGFQDNYLAFCAADQDGNLTGALKDYLDFASSVLQNASPTFEAVVYPTASAAMEAVRNGEVDCMFPANLSDYDAEQAGVVMTRSLMRTEMDAVVRVADKQDFLRKKQVRVGVNQGNPNYERFLLEHFPAWTPVFYQDTPACLDAIAAGEADTVIISNYRFRDISRQCDRLNLTTVYTGVNMDYCLAVREGSTTLYSILSKIIGDVPDSTVNAALTYYSADTSTPSIGDFILAYPIPAVISAAVALILIVFAVRGVLATKKPGKNASSRG